MATLARLGGFASPSQFSHVLNAPEFVASPLLVGRLTKIAAIVGHPVDRLLETPQRDEVMS